VNFKQTKTEFCNSSKCPNG